MYKITCMAASIALCGVAAQAGNFFGTKAEAQDLAERLVAIIEQDGINAAVDAIHDRDQPFLASRMGVNLFAGPMVIADNREPEMVAADFSETRDLTGETVWPRIHAAALKHDDVVLKWYHYDTQEEYDYHCFSAHADRDNGFVMICR